MVNSVSHNQILHSHSTTQRPNQDDATLSSRADNNSQAVSSDTVSLRNEPTQAATYSETLQLSAGDRSKYGMLQNLVANLLKEQGINTKISTDDTEIDLTTITPEQAQDLVSDDGYFGVKQTSDRIFQFATGIAGNDPSRIAAIKEGIDKGFAEAKKAFGDWLPDISYDTYDAVMKKLDNWVAESKAVA